MKYCQHCGKELQEDAAFCQGCGKPVASAEEPSAASQEINVQKAAKGGGNPVGRFVLGVILFIVIYTIVRILGIYLKPLGLF